LKAHGFNASPIHGDLDQSQRTKTLDGFRDGSLHLLVASDVAARGLDIPAVSHVFNFDVPSHPEDYVHRIGRTGRAGRKGKAFTIAVPSDEKYLTNIENLVKQQIPRGALPEGFVMPEGREDRAPSSRSDRGGKGRDSKSSRSSAPREREDRKPKVEAVVEPVVVEVPESRSPAPRRDDRRDERKDDRRRDDRRDDRRDERYRRDGGRDERVVGMGDHVPDFILRSFKLADRVHTEEPEEAPAPIEIDVEEVASATEITETIGEE
jgi:superfamily II DNA/RNA helicase